MSTRHLRHVRSALIPSFILIGLLVQSLTASPQEVHQRAEGASAPAVVRRPPGSPPDSRPPAPVPPFLSDPDRWHPSSEYFLVAPLDAGSTFLVDDQLRIVHEWRSDYSPGLSAYLRDDGSLLRTATIAGTHFNSAAGGNGGRVELYTWHGALQWSLEYATDRVQQHHDAILLPNGHVLMVAWETRSIAEALDAGRNPDTLPSGPEIWSDTLVEIDLQTGATTWVWRVWDHLVPKGRRPVDSPERIDPSFAAPGFFDWTHVNAVAYNAALDQVVISSRHFSEIWIVDHGTTSQEAAGHTGGRRGHGGDLLYRWGHPAAYGATGSQQLYGQHNAHWIRDGLPGAGHILLFNNGDPSLRPWSTAVEIIPPLRQDGLYTPAGAAGFEPAGPVWQYAADQPESLFGTYASGVQRLGNGNTILAVTPTGRFREVDAAGQLVRDYQLASKGTNLRMFRVTSFPPTSPAFASYPLVPNTRTLGQVLYFR